MPPDFAERDASGVANRIAIRAGADRGKTDGLDLVPGGEREAGSIARGQRFGFSAAAIAIHGTDGVKHEARGKQARGGGNSAASWAASGFPANPIELSHYGGAANAMNGAIDTASAGERGVSGIHHGIHRDARNIADQQLQQFAAGKTPFHNDAAWFHDDSVLRRFENGFAPAAPHIHFVFDAFDGRARIMPVD